MIRTGNLFTAPCAAIAALVISVAILSGCPPVMPPPIDDVVPPPPSLAPGLRIEVVKVEVPSDGRPEVVFELKDDRGNRVAESELLDARFILARLEAAEDGGTDHYVSYTTTIEDPDRVPNSGDEAVQAAYDTARLNGITRNSDGTLTYKFAAALPASFDPDQSHQVAGQFRRFFVVDGKEYKFNLAHAFVPSGAKQALQRREFVTTESCNACHTRLSVHGDIRREVQLCIMCHTPQSADAQSGNSLDFATMIHKIHRGVDLPSVLGGDPYQIIGFGGSVHDYSSVVFPQDLRNCQVCHGDAPQGDAHLTAPTLAGCASCHDRTWFGNPDQTPAGFTNHTGGQHLDNALCSICHKPSGPAPAPIAEAHIVPTGSDNAPGLDFNILSVTTAPRETGGHTITVNFEALDRDGSRYGDLGELSSAGIVIAYPAPEYEATIREVVRGAAAPPGTLTANSDGTHTYVFRAALPDEAQTFAVAMEGRIAFTFRGQNFQQGTASSGRVFAAISGVTPVARRAIVDGAKCDACHGDVRAHGEQRAGVDFCVMCHNVNATDVARRPQDALPPETINFKDMIHRIHSGENLDGEYTVYGFGGVAHDFTHIRFSGLRQECNICHVPGTASVPLSEDTLPTTITQAGEIVSEVMPERASCTSCHDSLMSNIHAVLATDPVTQAESCAVCHGADSAFAVPSVHALAP